MANLSIEDVREDIKTRSTGFLQTVFKLLVFTIKFNPNNELVYEILAEVARRNDIDPEGKTNEELYKLVYNEEEECFINDRKNV
ncbi:hypothetical protein [uncultured Anaerococcus sp.]|uniref:hypothetical protein n=1 Tax=uncultured Anaerococcus sp. TaxID=293428 RepID=UPI0025FD0B5C|nr:hypothetical protein [uncultured Anaerococcus sp.]